MILLLLWFLLLTALAVLALLADEAGERPGAALRRAPREVRPRPAPYATLRPARR